MSAETETRAAETSLQLPEAVAQAAEPAVAERVVRREDFAPGPFGERCYALIVGGNPCEYRTDPKDYKTACGKLGVGTVETDLSVSVEIFVHCEDHGDALNTSLSQVQLEVNNYVVFNTRNGWGRVSQDSDTTPSEGQ